ncbi:hypothetical protein J7K86_00890 [bacterium]|nr:hypothetical protein [bacterium]
MKKNNLAVFFLIVFSFLIIGLIFFQLKNNIFGPFVRSQIKNKQSVARILSQIQSKDTDHDGLTDLDEQTKYHTSIYLPDSDSDGFSDKEEIDAGSNPLNPYSTPENKKLLKETPVLEKEFNQPATTKESISADKIREILINQAGFSKEIVDKLDDKTLIELYNKTKESTGINPENLIQDSQVENNFSVIFDPNADAKEIRKFLVNLGIDEKELNKIDDQTLKKIYLKALSDVLNNTVE